MSASLPRPGDPRAIWIVDLSSVMRTAWGAILHATHAPGARAEEHPLVRATMGWLATLIGEHNPARLVFALDHRSRPWQADLWPAYKADREDPGEAYWEELGIVRGLLGLHRMPIFEAAGFQADDLVAALVRASEGLAAVVVSRDHDLWQLVDDARPVVCWDGKGAPIDEAAVCARYHGIGPTGLGDLKALAGEEDEAPGVPGIGEKTAALLLSKHGSLTAALERWQWETKGVSRKQREALRDHAEQARLSRELVGLRADAPIGGFHPDDAIVAWSRADAAEIRAQGRELGVRVLQGVDWKRAAVEPQRLALGEQEPKASRRAAPALASTPADATGSAGDAVEIGTCPNCSGPMWPGACERRDGELFCVEAFADVGEQVGDLEQIFHGDDIPF